MNSERSATLIAELPFRQVETLRISRNGPTVFLRVFYPGPGGEPMPGNGVLRLPVSMLKPLLRILAQEAL